jgi:diguanylate cyclase (GGDEF)-like protein
VGGQADGEALRRAVRYAIERGRVDARIRRLAHYDHLTGLANRALFRDALERALGRAERSREPLALIFIDIDRFKAINDTLGHATGDKVLRSVADRLGSVTRRGDTVGRIGGGPIGATTATEIASKTEDAAERGQGTASLIIDLEAAPATAETALRALLRGDPSSPP